MPSTESFPFKRLIVDRLVYGMTRIWWRLHPNFTDPAPHLYQLQIGRTQLPHAADWEDVGPAVANAAMLTTPARDDVTNQLDLTYRVRLTTPIRTYVSLPVAARGHLTERDWCIAREIVRKEQLNHRLTACHGALLIRQRFGIPCTRCRDPMTEAVTDSRCPVCYGTGFVSGYHAPLPFYCFTMEEVQQQENRGGALENPSAWSEYLLIAKARVIGFPLVSKEDVFVDASTDQRWRIQATSTLAAIRGFPLVTGVLMRTIPTTDPVYQIEIGGEPGEYLAPTLPTVGCGSVAVDHDYGGTDRLAYVSPTGEGIAGAKILAYPAEVYDNGHTTPNYAIASTTTVANGRWAQALRLDPGMYVLIYSRPGAYGPDRVDLTVTEPNTPQAQPPIPDRYAPTAFGAF